MAAALVNAERISDRRLIRAPAARSTSRRIARLVVLSVMGISTGVRQHTRLAISPEQQCF